MEDDEIGIVGTGPEIDRFVLPIGRYIECPQAGQ